MCCAEFIAKYVLFIVNLAFSLLGIAIVGLGIAVLVALKDLNQILPVNVIPISMIVLGIIVFFIAFLACCGAIRESQCMLVSYAIAVGVLAALKLWLTVVIFSALGDMQGTVDGWIVSSFNNNNIRPAFHIMEASFHCCGTTGPNSYISNSEPLPPTCCENPEWNPEWANPELNPGVNVTQCTVEAAFDGCGVMVGSWFETFGGAVGAVLIIVIVVEIMAVIITLLFCNAIRNKRRRNY